MARRQLTTADRERGRRLAEHLRAARAALPREQADLARRTGVSVDMIRKLERNQVPTPSFVIVARLARDLAVSLDDLAEEVLDK